MLGVGMLVLVVEAGVWLGFGFGIEDGIGDGVVDGVGGGGVVGVGDGVDSPTGSCLSETEVKGVHIV